MVNVDPHRWVMRWTPTQVKSRDAHVLPLVGCPVEIIQHRWQHRPECRYLFHEKGSRPARFVKSGTHLASVIAFR
jgi:hypothetical protein